MDACNCFDCGHKLLENEDKCSECGWTYNVAAELSEESEPVCIQCASEIFINQHYCSKCGNVVGRYTEYQPFEGIRFSYSIYGALWKRVWYDDNIPLSLKIFYMVFLLFFVPYYVVFIPIEIYKKLRVPIQMSEGE